MLITKEDMIILSVPIGTFIIGMVYGYILRFFLENKEEKNGDKKNGKEE